MARPRSKSKSNDARRTPRWVGPAALGAGLALGVGLFARRASAKGATASSADEPTSAEPTSDEITFPVYSGQEGAFMLQELGSTAGLDREWMKFFTATARGESAFTSNVVLGDRKLYPPGSKPSPETDRLGPGEASGARRAHQRAVDEGRLTGCPWPASAYTWGSGGWFGMLPANAWHAYTNTTLRCRHPWYLLHPVDHVVVAIEFARRLTGWSTFKADPTWLTLRVGWGNPSAMADPARREAVARRFTTQLEALGISSAFLKQKITALPSRAVEERWGVLMRTFDLDPGRTS
jgi:hypothetical protein